MARLFRGSATSETSGARASGYPDAALQSPHRGGLCRLDSAVHRVFGDEASPGAGGGGDLRVPLVAGGPRTRQRVDAEPGAQRVAVPVSRCARHGSRAGCDPTASASAGPAAGGAQSGEVRAVLDRLAGTTWLVVALLYGAGLRLSECLELRVKDVDVERGQIVVRRGKGQKDRVTVLPTAVRDRLIEHLRASRRSMSETWARGVGRVVLPFGLERKFPNAAVEWRWQFVFPRRASAVTRGGFRRAAITCTSRWCSGR